MLLPTSDYIYRPNSPNSMQFTNGNRGVIDLPSGVCSLNDTVAIAICVWVKPKNKVGEVPFFSYVPQNPSPGNLQSFTVTLDPFFMGTETTGSSSNSLIGGTSYALLANQWNMVTVFIKGGFTNFPRLYLDATLMDSRALIMNYNSTQPMRFTFDMASQWETEWNNLQIWPNSALINPVTKFAAERAYYGR